MSVYKNKMCLLQSTSAKWSQKDNKSTHTTDIKWKVKYQF